MGIYSALLRLAGPGLRARLPTMSPRHLFETARQLEAWEYGSGQDYRYTAPQEDDAMLASALREKVL